MWPNRSHGSRQTCGMMAWARRRARALAVDGQRCAASRRAARGVGRRRTRTLTHNVLARIAVPKPHWLSLPSLDITPVYVTVGMRGTKRRSQCSCRKLGAVVGSRNARAPLGALAVGIYSKLLNHAIGDRQ